MLIIEPSAVETHNLYLGQLNVIWNLHTTQGQLNTNKPSYQYSDSYWKYKTISRPSHLYDGTPYTLIDGLYIETGPCTQTYHIR